MQALKKVIDDADRQKKANAGKKIQADLAAKLTATPPGEFYIEYIPDANQKVTKYFNVLFSSDIVIWS